MKRSFVFVFLAWTLSACAGPQALTGPNCGSAVCVVVQLTGLIRLNEPVPVTIIVQPEEDIRGLGIYLLPFPPSVLIEGERRWTVDARAGQTITVQSALRFTELGLSDILAQASNPRRGGAATYSLRVHLTLAGGTIYLPGTPLPITPAPLPIVTLPAPLTRPTPTRAPYP